MGETESPQSKVGRRVRDTTETELYRVNGLMDVHLTRIKCLQQQQQQQQQQ